MSRGTVTTPAGLAARGKRTQGALPGRAPRGPAGRPGRAGPPAGQGRPGRMAAPARSQPGRRPGAPPAAPRTRPAGARPRPAAAARPSRMPFVFLIVGLLGGGLLCLLLVNTILDTGTYRITTLQQQNITLLQQTQALQAQIVHEESPSVLAAQAIKLGMTEPGLLHFLDLRKRQIESEPQHMAGIPPVPGYTP